MMIVAQHFLLSANARTLSVVQVARMSEDEARNKFRVIRWAATDGEPSCPRRGCLAVYEYASVPTIRARVAPGTRIYADEASGWHELHDSSPMGQINHRIAFSDEDAYTNQVESFFSRLRRAEIGQHHHISGHYLRVYAGEMAWRENTRRKTNGTLFTLTAATAMSQPVSRQ